MNLYSNAVITPGGSQWQITVCESTTNPIQSARSNGVSFTFTLTSVASVTCVKYTITN
jgi:hypothetical protein